ncbi:MAG: FtsX-like permease family protein [Acidobacteriota bacterium]
MRFLPLIIKSILRNRRRTLLTVAGVSLSVFVITALRAVEAGFGALVSSAGDSLLNVYEKDVACPVSSRVFDAYLSTIAATPGVVGSTGVLRGIYTYRSKENIVIVAGVDFDRFRSLKEVRIEEGSEAEFVTRDDGALVGARLAHQYGWKLGQIVSLVEDRLTFTVAGIFRSNDTACDGWLLLHKSYLARVKRDEGKSTYMIVQVRSPGSVAPVSRSIDAALANFPKPTKTQSERAAKEEELKDFVEVRTMLSGMVLATILVSILGAANSVSMSVRERTREVGILRSLGLRKRQILEILLGEFVLVAAVGGGIGIALATALLASGRSLGGYVPVILTPGTALFAMGIAVLIGLLGAIVPGINASRSRIVEALRTLD